MLQAEDVVTVMEKYCDRESRPGSIALPRDSTAAGADLLNALGVPRNLVTDDPVVGMAMAASFWLGVAWREQHDTSSG